MASKQSAMNESWTEYGARRVDIVVDCGGQDWPKPSCVCFVATPYNPTTTWWRHPFDFWDDPAEDIYTLDDGEPV